MYISHYASFIREFPFENQSFDIKKANWKVLNQQHLVDNIFSHRDTITLNRFDLANARHDIETFILKTLM